MSATDGEGRRFRGTRRRTWRARPRPAHEPVTVCWEGPFFEAIGYAAEARAFVLGLDDLSVAMHLRPVVWTGEPCAIEASARRRLLQLARTPPAGCRFHVHHGFPPRWRPARAAFRKIGRTMFETDRIPAGWVRACNAMDEVWVPSEFNLETFAASGVRRELLAVVPAPIAMSHFRPRPAATAPLAPRPFTYLSIFDWSWRKGWDVLLRAFCAEFRREHDDVALLLKVNSSYGRSGRDLRQIVRSFIERDLRVSVRRVPRIRILTGSLPERLLPSVYWSADTFVLPTRGEGWGRTLMEAMATGLPTIGTRWGGSLAFMTERNSYLCETEALVPVPAHAYFEAPAFRGHRWAEPSVDHLRVLMRRVLRDPTEARRKGRRASAAIGRRYDAPVVCRQVTDRLAELAG